MRFPPAVDLSPVGEAFSGEWTNVSGSRGSGGMKRDDSCRRGGCETFQMVAWRFTLIGHKLLVIRGVDAEVCMGWADPRDPQPGLLSKGCNRARAIKVPAG